jgi:SAM-dependent methyltransferase
MDSFSHFGKPEFWEDYYRTTGSAAYDWFQDYTGTKDIIGLTLDAEQSKSSYSLLDVGCGTSEVLQKLYLEGFDHLVGIDNNEKAIRAAEQRNKNLSEAIKCELTRPGNGCTEYELHRRNIHPYLRQRTSGLFFGKIIRAVMTQAETPTNTSPR